MEQAAWGHVRGDLSRIRRRAAAFLDNLPHEGCDCITGQQTWSAEWTTMGDNQCLLGDSNLNNRWNDGGATEAWLCALTAFEMARRLVDKDDPQCEIISAKIDACLRRFELCSVYKIDRVKIADWDQTEVLAYHLPVGGRAVPAPAVICISKEDESATMLLGRLLPMIGRDISVFVVSYDDIPSHSHGHSQSLLSFCLDYLSGRPDVDASRIGVYGEGLSAVLATELAAVDRRVAAAVCDGGLWNLTRSIASVNWMTRGGDLDEGVISTRRSQLMRRLTCPVLVVAGGRGIVSVSEAIKLQTDCMMARIDLDLAVPRMIPASDGSIENFVASDACIFEWLKHKLASNSARSPHHC